MWTKNEQNWTEDDQIELRMIITEALFLVYKKHFFQIENFKIQHCLLFFSQFS